MALDAEKLIPKVAALVAVSRQRAEVESLKSVDLANQVTAVADAGATDNLQSVIDSVAAEIDAEVIRLNAQGK